MHSFALSTALALFSPQISAQVQPTPAARPLEAREIAPLLDGAPAANIVLDLPKLGCVELHLAKTTLVTDDFRLEAARVEGGKTISRSMRALLPNAYAGTIAGIEDAKVYLGFGTGAARGLAA